MKINVYFCAGGHLVSAARLDDSTLRVLVLSMQNSPFDGNSGAVARMQLHAMDSMDTQSYPVSLLNVTSGCTDGIDRLSSIQSVGWFATRVVHDTTVVEVHDTSYVDVFVHDTTYIHDTTVTTEYVPVHDTTIVTDTLTVTEYVPVHDTTYINLYVHDTTYINVPYPVHDTAFINIYVHNTSYINVYVHDTTFVTDTLWLTEFDTIYIHDTTYIHDTIVVGMDDVEAISAKVYINNGQVVVEGAEGSTVMLYDAVGRLLATRRDDYSALRFDVPASGTYLVKVGDLPARRVVVLR